jgi:hypothetical protein
MEYKKLLARYADKKFKPQIDKIFQSFGFKDAAENFVECC